MFAFPDSMSTARLSALPSSRLALLCTLYMALWSWDISQMLLSVRSMAGYPTGRPSALDSHTFFLIAGAGIVDPNASIVINREQLSVRVESHAAVSFRTEMRVGGDDVRLHE